MSEWKIAGCVREDGEWHHLPTRTGAKGFVSTWDISKEILDIAERALELLEIANRYMHGDFDDGLVKVAALLAECSGDGKCPTCGNYPAPQPTIADRPCLCKPKQPTVANQMIPCDEWASLIILADEVDKLKGQLEKDDL
tara:strand:+ start:513 stop:932 length:420 start_codon:yes stop_codon:yes gene_type:complete